MTGQVKPDGGNPDTNINDPTGNLTQAVSDMIDNFTTDFGSEVQNQIDNKNLTGLWRHRFRIVRRPNAPAGTPGAVRPGYKSMKELKKKKDGLNWVDQTAQGIKHDMLKQITDSLAGVGLAGQFRVVVRVCPMTDAHHQDQDHCGCGCEA